MQLETLSEFFRWSVDDEIGNRREPVNYEDIPQRLIDALIATEDVRFYSHLGVDLQSLMRDSTDL